MKDLLKNVADNSASLIYIVDLDGRFLFANRALEALLGAAAGGSVGKARDTFLPSALAEEHRQNDLATLRAGVSLSFEEQTVQSDGVHVYTTVKFPLRDEKGEVYAVGGISTDITDRVRAEHAARKSEADRARLLHVLEASLNEIHVFDTQSLRFEFVNRGALANLGYTYDAMRTMTPVDLKPEFTEASFRAVLGPLLRNELSQLVFETVHRRVDGSLYPVEVHVQLVETDGSRVFLAVILDITERRRAAEKLREAGEQWRLTFDASRDAICLLDADHVIERSNRAMAELTGEHPEALRGRRCWEVVHRTSEPIPDCPMVRARTSLVRERMEFQEAGRWFDIIVDPIVDEHGHFRGAVHNVRDVTERKRVEAERLEMQALLAQSQRLESVGTLASGVAHEINNPLNVVMNYAQLILDEDGRLSPTSRDYAKGIVRESERMATIVRDLLAFSRDEKEHHSPADVATLVTSTLSLIRTVFRKDQIGLVVDIPADLPTVRCRSQQIRQVLMNLLTNARDALNERFPGAAPDKQLRVLARSFEDEGVPWVRVTVEDQGGGINPDVAEHVFDPFFTTKPRDKGTGLGLSISYGIVKEHEGKLWFETEPGVGTRFHVDLKVHNGWSLDEPGHPADANGLA